MKQFFIYSLIILLPLSACSQKSSEQQSTTAETQAPVEVKQIDVTALSKIDFSANPDIVLLDVRTDAEVNEGKIANSKHIDVLITDQFNKEVKELDKTKTYYIYCRSGGRSSRAAESMKAMGFTNLYNVEGGITAWNANGLPVE